MNNLKQKRNDLKQKRFERDYKKGLDMDYFLLFAYDTGLYFEKVKIVNKSEKYAKKYIPPKILQEMKLSSTIHVKEVIKKLQKTPDLLTAMKKELNAINENLDKIKKEVDKTYEDYDAPKINESNKNVETYYIISSTSYRIEFTAFYILKVCSLYDKVIHDYENRNNFRKYQPRFILKTDIKKTVVSIPQLIKLSKLKECPYCNTIFRTNSNSQKRCPKCGKRIRKIQTEKFLRIIKDIPQYERDELLIEYNDPTLVSNEEFFKK